MRSFRLAALAALCAVVALASCASLALAHGDEASAVALPTSVVALTDAEFDARVAPVAGDQGDWLIQFYAPWCGHCKSLTGTWAQLGDAMAATGGSVRIGQVDATVQIASAKRFGIRGFPTIKLFSRGKIFDYKGPRTLEALSKFAQSGGAGVEGQGIPEPPTQFAVLIEAFIAMSGDVQTILMRKPLVGVAFFVIGLLVGILISVIVFTTCLEPQPSEYVQYKDATTGQLVTVPYVRPTPQVASASSTPPASASSSNTKPKKEQ